MGLDAAVFRNVTNLEREFGAGIFDVDETTGEAELKDTFAGRMPRQARFALKRRIGNIAVVGDLRDAIVKYLRNDASLLLTKVLYSGSHSGDQIDLAMLPQLRAEVESLGACGAEEVVGFAEDMKALIDAAESERNPIVFI